MPSLKSFLNLFTKQPPAARRRYPRKGPAPQLEKTPRKKPPMIYTGPAYTGSAQEHLDWAKRLENRVEVFGYKDTETELFSGYKKGFEESLAQAEKSGTPFSREDVFTFRKRCQEMEDGLNLKGIPPLIKPPHSSTSDSSAVAEDPAIVELKRDSLRQANVDAGLVKAEDVESPSNEPAPDEVSVIRAFHDERPLIEHVLEEDARYDAEYVENLRTMRRRVILITRRFTEKGLIENLQPMFVVSAMLRVAIEKKRPIPLQEYQRLSELVLKMERLLDNDVEAVA